MDLVHGDGSISHTKPTDKEALQKFVDNQSDQAVVETQRLVEEFNNHSMAIDRILTDSQRRMAGHVQVRRDVVAGLVENRYGKKHRTYREVAALLGISAARVGQLMKESTNYVNPFPEDTTAA